MVFEDANVSDWTSMLDCFYRYFIASGSLFSSSPPADSSAPGSLPVSDDVYIPARQPFSFTLFTVEEVHRVLLSLQITKSAGLEGLDPLILKLAADFIAKPIQCIFNVTITTNHIPAIWKVANVLPLLKGGDPTCLNNY